MRRYTLLLLALLVVGLFLWVRQGTRFPFLPVPGPPSLPPAADAVWEETAKQLGKKEFDLAGRTLKFIYASALEGRRWGEAVRALVALRAAEAVQYRIGFAEQVFRLRLDAASAPDGMRPLLRLVALNWHQSKLWELFQDPRREAPGRPFAGEDPLTWEPARYYRHVLRLQDELLGEADLLKNQRTADYLAFLGERNVDPRLLPTLYDVAASHLLEFHQSFTTFSAYPEDPVEIPADSDALGPVDRFLSFVPRAADPCSPRFRALALYQSLIRFHARKGNAEAVWNYDLQRLKYLRQTAEGEGLVERYLEQLRRLVAVSRGKTRQRASCCLGKELYDLGRYDESFRAAWAGDPGSSKDQPVSYECRILRYRLLERRCKLRVGHVCAAADPIRFRVESWNVRRLHFRIYRDRFDRRLKAINSSLSYEEYLDLISTPPDRAWSVDLPARRGVGPVRCEVETPALPPGPWLLFASPDKDFRGEGSMPLRAEFWVSRFVLLSRDLGGTVDGYALDFKTGAPLPGVRVNGVQREDPGLAPFASPAVTDAGGHFAFPVPLTTRPVPSGSDDKVRALFHARAADGSELLQFQCYTLRRPHTLPRHEPRTLLFTDRSLYRPGQTVRFKGICVHADPVAGSYQVLPGRSVSVRLEGGGGGPVAKGSFRTNRFGSFSGEFCVPAGVATGPVWLIASEPRGEVRLNLEAYRLPTFRVDLGAPAGQTRLGETAEAPGRVQSLTGAAVAGASVRGGFHFRMTLVRDGRVYQVNRRVDVPWTDRKLNLRWERFRSDLQPGGSETWTLRIRRPAGASKDTEVLAVLYDASQDLWGELPPHTLADPAGLLRSEAAAPGGSYSNHLDVSELPGLEHNRSLTEDRIACWLPAFGDLRWIGPRGAFYQGVCYAASGGRSAVSASPPDRIVDPLNAAGPRAGEDGPVPPGSPPGPGGQTLASVPARSSFGETAVFLPHLRPGPDGVVTIPLRMPNSLTLWRFLGLAHGPDLGSGLADVIRGPDKLEDVELVQDAKQFRVRVGLSGCCGKVFQAAGVAIPPMVRQRS